MSTPFFADLVRELCQEGGTGPLTPNGAVPGHRRFAGAVPPGTLFHYAVAGIAHPDEWEVGTGQIDGGGRLVRQSVSASSNGGSPVDFTVGLKTLALTVGAGWFASRDTAAATASASLEELGLAVAAKQPLSTGHDSATTGAAGDTLTVRRGAGWVNIPLTALAYRDAGGMVVAGAALGGAPGSAAAPSLSFAANPNTGLFNPEADAIGFAAGGTERARLTATGLGIGGAASHALHLRGAAPTTCIEATTTTGTVIGTKGPRLLLQSNSNTIGNGGEIVFAATGDTDVERWAAISGHILTNTASGAFGDLIVATKAAATDTALSPRLAIQASGVVRPGADNVQNLAAASYRWNNSYFGASPTVTSDAREKSWQGAADARELRAAGRIAAELGFYQWNDAITEKGAGAARRHFGVRAQAVWAIMADEGLIDPIGADGRPGATPYAFLCWDEWADTASGEGGDRFGIRPDQLALFLIAAQEQRLAALETAA
ncbi:tail fiber domain-containing protein [Sphingopyxis sp. H115]|uniref:tail fiber domain-containing protein n=1 Tax=Sphingopyxis sp. H115 TaxID=1759073 RepID=UPI0007366469|nr:tail fiber domain-containing protein [Sphingopyxis sp. H115]KTE00419.1 hypothetical protein ATE71_21155 [Sphingopyxis sp. H115]